MSENAESVRDFLAREAAEAEDVAEQQDHGRIAPARGQRGGRQAAHPSQVYSIRIPVERLEQLRRLAEAQGVAPTVLMRQFVLERLDQESAPVTITPIPQRAPDELRLGYRRNEPLAEVVPLAAGE